MQVQELVGIVPWNFVAMMANLFIQVYLLKRFLFKPVSLVLEKRRGMADAEITDAARDKSRAAAIREEYEKNMGAAKRQASDILETAQKTAVHQKEEMIKDASAQAAVLMKRAQEAAAREKRKAMEEIKTKIAGMAVEIAEKVLEREIRREDHERLIEEFIEKAGEAS